MPQLPSLSYDSVFYSLLNGALNAGGFENAEVFFRDEFSEETFPNTKWQELFPAAAESNDDGKIHQINGVNTAPRMAVYTSEGAEGHLIHNRGFEVQSVDMPQARISYGYDEKSFLDGQRLLRNSGIPEYVKLYSSFLKDTTDLIAGIHTLRSYTALQVESTNKYVTDRINNNGGIVGLTYDFTVGQQAVNNKLAGHFADSMVRQGKPHDWTQSTAYPLGDLRDMIWDYETILKQDASMAVFRMSKHDSNLFYNHITTKQEVILWKNGGLVNMENLALIHIAPKDVDDYMAANNFPPISVEKWHGITSALDPETKTMIDTPIEGFKSGQVLLRPAGPVGTYQWKSPTTMFATSVDPMYLADGGRIGIQQETKALAKEMYFCAESKGFTVPGNVNLQLRCDISTNQETT